MVESSEFQTMSLFPATLLLSGMYSHLPESAAGTREDSARARNHACVKPTFSPTYQKSGVRESCEADLNLPHRRFL